MSQSPTPQSNSDQREAYSTAWAALKKLLRQGKSESGLERNCCFLNLGEKSQKFATVSAATSLDFPDDARGQALCDWDHDGRTDIWITNRTGPRVRLMLNRYDTAANKFVSLRLRGDGKTVNADAIGSRIEVYVPGHPQPLLRTVTAGNGFLSQSSVWQTVGLGAVEKIDKVVVKWAGGQPETFTGAEINGFYDLKQGEAKVRAWKNPDAPIRLPNPPTKPPEEETEAARLVLLRPLPVAASFLPAPTGNAGLIVSIWSIDCPNCRTQMEDWAKQQKQWAAAGVPVACWCADADQATADARAKEVKWDGEMIVSGGNGPAAELLGVLNALQQSCCGLQKDLPVPATFLFDAKKRLVAIYKGPVKSEQITTDLSLLTLDSMARLAAASPDNQGKWHDPIGATGVRASIAVMLESGMKSEAEKLLEANILIYNEPLAANATGLDESWNRKEFASAQSMLALWDMERKDYAKSEQRYLISIQALPINATRQELIKLYMSLNNPKVYPALEAVLSAVIKLAPSPEDLAKLGVLKLELGKPAEAIPLLASSLKTVPDATNYFQLAQAQKASGDTKEAQLNWNKALQLNPKLLPALNNLAWSYATNTEASLRNAAKALELAKTAVELSSGKHPMILATQAAAQAENGDFPASAKTLQSALALAAASKDTKISAALTDWLTTVKAGKPLREVVQKQ